MADLNRAHEDLAGVSDIVNSTDDIEVLRGACRLLIGHASRGLDTVEYVQETARQALASSRRSTNMLALMTAYYVVTMILLVVF